MLSEQKFFNKLFLNEVMEHIKKSLDEYEIHQSFDYLYHLKLKVTFVYLVTRIDEQNFEVDLQLN